MSQTAISIVGQFYLQQGRCIFQQQMLYTELISIIKVLQKQPEDMFPSRQVDREVRHLLICKGTTSGCSLPCGQFAECCFIIYLD